MLRQESHEDDGKGGTTAPPIPKTKKKDQTIMNYEVTDLRDEIPENPPQLSDEMTSIIFPKAPDHTVNICVSLLAANKEAPIQFLFENKDIFAWSPSDMLNINHNIIYHSLKVDGRSGVYPKEAKPRPETRASCERRGGKAVGSPLDSGNQIPYVTFQRCSGTEGQRQVANVR